MEGVKQICCVLDACTIINLLNIDSGDFLVKKLKHIDISIPEKVFYEINKNGKNKIEKSTFRNSEEKQLALTDRESALSFFRRFIISNEKIKSDLEDPDFFNRIKLLIEYDKDNGEFYSTALSFYHSRYNESKVYFHTDDLPAKQKFSSDYLFHQIGYVEDSVDLLVLLYRLSDSDFTKIFLDNFLSNLFSEYAIIVKEFSKTLTNFLSRPPKIYVKDNFLKGNISLLRNNLEKNIFNGINKIKNDFERKPGYSDIKDIFAKFYQVFELESMNEGNLLKKIIDYRNQLKSKDIYKLFSS